MDKDDILIRSNTLMRLASGLKAKRIMLGWSIRRLSEVAHVSPTTIRMLESGQRSAEITTVFRLMTCLGLQFEVTDVDGFIDFSVE